MGEAEEERNTTSVCFSSGVPTYDFVSGEDGDRFPKALFLQSSRCKTKDGSL